MKFNGLNNVFWTIAKFKYTPLYYPSTEAMVLQSETLYWMGIHALKVFRYAEWYPTELVVEPGAV